MIVSTGMAYLSEVEAAVRTIQEAGNRHVVLLHCVSNYPTEPREVNLKAMETLRKAFGVPVGFSDHTLGIEVALAAVALGGCIIEKHFTMDRSLPGPDHRVSLEPHELSALIRGIRIVEKSLGDGVKQPTEKELEVANSARKSLVARTAIPKGSTLTEDLISIKRPGDRDQTLRASRGHRTQDNKEHSTWGTLDPGDACLVDKLCFPRLLRKSPDARRPRASDRSVLEST
jgi:sialic acid synthase SpsE